MTRWSSFPLGIGNTIEFVIHDPIPVKEMPFPALFEKTKQEIIT
jgi:1-acyl-sn-glycerol-3-phosphate acyltransferase